MYFVGRLYLGRRVASGYVKDGERFWDHSAGGEVV